MFIIIETFGGPEYSIVCTDPETGLAETFNTKGEAEEYAKNCQEPVIVEL